MTSEVVKVLVIEDKEDDFRSLRTLLHSVGTSTFVLDWEQTYEKGVAALLQHQHDVCLLDSLLGTASGLDLLREAVASGCKTPVILLTAHEDYAVDVQATSIGATDYLVKEQLPASLLERAIRYALKRKHTAQSMVQQRADFLAMLTHDIKNPVSIILGYTDVLIDEVRNGKVDELPEILERLKSNALTVHSLVSNYLDLSMIEARRILLSKRCVNMNGLLRHLGQRYETEARHRQVQLDCLLQDGLPPVMGDEIALERVFANLIYNALKYTPASGRITVRSGVRNGMLVVSVSDTGTGIVATEIPRLFEYHKSMEADSEREGTGLGLKIVKALVEAHHGRVEVQSTLGEGSCFSVFLPIMDVAHTSVDLSAATSSPS